MSMRSRYGCYPAIKIIAHRNLLARSFRMEIHKDWNIFRNLLKRTVNRLERTVRRRHENASESIDNGKSKCGHRDDAPPLPWALRREIHRSYEIIHGIYLPRKLLLPPSMITERNRICPRLEKLLGQSRRNARACRTVLRIGYHSIHAHLALDARHFALENLTPGRTHNITNHQNLHNSALLDFNHFAAFSSPRAAFARSFHTRER